MHGVLCGEDVGFGESEATVQSDDVQGLVQLLMATGQMPPEKQVLVEDEGKNILRLNRYLYRVQPVRERTAEAVTLEAMSLDADRTPVSEIDISTKTASVNMESFVEMLQSELVCIWGECHNIRERQRVKKQREDEEEYERNPPLWKRTWQQVTSPFSGGTRGSDSDAEKT